MKTYALAGNIIGRKPQNGGNGGGYREEVAYTMDTIGNFGIAQVEDDMEQQVYDARRNGDGKTVGTITGDHANRVTDFTPIVASFIGGQGSKARSIGYVDEATPTLKASGGNQVPDIVCFHGSQDPRQAKRDGGENRYVDDASPTIRSNMGDNQTAVASTKLSVRRLMPIECERLMGLPDNWTKIPWRGKPADECPDAPRYKACGNSMGVNCMRWIGLGIEAVEDGIRQKQQAKEDK